MFLNLWLFRKWKGCLEIKGKGKNNSLGRNWSRIYLTSPSRINLKTILLTKYLLLQSKNLKKRVKVYQLIQEIRPVAMLRPSNLERWFTTKESWQTTSMKITMKHLNFKIVELIRISLKWRESTSKKIIRDRKSYKKVV